MGFFNKKTEKEPNFEVWEALSSLKSDVMALKGHIEIVEQSVKNLRGLVNRKLKLESDENEEDEKGNNYKDWFPKA